MNVIYRCLMVGCIFREGVVDSGGVTQFDLDEIVDLYLFKAPYTSS